MGGVHIQTRSGKLLAAGVLLLCGAVTAGILLSAGKSPEAVGGREKRTVLTVTFASGDEGWNQAVTLAGDAFSRQNPDIRLELRPSTRTPGGFYDDFLRKAAATDELGDIVELKNTRTAVEYQMFSPLPEELTDLMEDTWRAPDGTAYTLPLVRLEQGMIYNESVFDALELSPPKTWQEFEGLCAVLKERRYTPLVVGAGDYWHLMFWGRYFFNSCVTADHPSWQQDCTLGKVSWTDPEPKKMAERFSGLFGKGYVHGGYAATGDAETCEIIANGKAVMLYALCNQIPKIQSLNPDMELGWFFMPDENGQKYSFDDKSGGWAVTAECGADEKKYDAAVKFLELFYSREVYQEVCNIMNGLPVTKEGIRIEDSLLQDIKVQAEAGVLKPDEQIGDENTPEGFDSAMYRHLMELFEGKAAEEQVLEELQKEWESRNPDGAEP